MFDASRKALKEFQSGAASRLGSLDDDHLAIWNSEAGITESTKGMANTQNTVDNNIDSKEEN